MDKRKERLIKLIEAKRTEVNANGELTVEWDAILHYLKNNGAMPSDIGLTNLSQYPLLYGVINQYDFFCRQWMPYDEDVEPEELNDDSFDIKKRMIMDFVSRCSKISEQDATTYIEMLRIDQEMKDLEEEILPMIKLLSYKNLKRLKEILETELSIN